MIKATAAGFDALGIEADAILQTCGIHSAVLDDPFTMITGDVLSDLWLSTLHRFDDATLPTRAGLAIPPYAFDLFEHIVWSTDTFGQAIHLINRYRRLMSWGTSLYLTREEDDWVWISDGAHTPYGAVVEQWYLAALYGAFRNAGGFGAEEVHLSIEDRGQADHFTALWDAPVRLGSRKTGIRLSPGILEEPNPRANEYLKRTLCRLADRIETSTFATPGRLSTYTAKVMRAFDRGEYSEGTVAASFSLSPRSLQRRLAKEHTSFTTLLDLHRRRRAFSMLSDGERNLGAIAFALGYHEQSSFNHAFRRWTGTNPTAWIERGSPAV